MLGTPAEEGGGGKVLLLERGAFDGAHAAMMVHPWPEDRLDRDVPGRRPLRRALPGQGRPRLGRPEQGVNAADAMTVAQVAIGLLRQHFRPGDQVHGIVTEGGRRAEHRPGGGTGRFMVPGPDPRGPGASRAASRALLRGRAPWPPGARSRSATWPRPTRTWCSDDLLLDAYRANAEALGRRFAADDDREAAAHHLHRHGQRLARRARHPPA